MKTFDELDNLLGDVDCKTMVVILSSTIDRLASEDHAGVFNALLLTVRDIRSQFPDAAERLAKAAKQLGDLKARATAVLSEQSGDAESATKAADASDDFMSWEELAQKAHATLLKCEEIKDAWTLISRDLRIALANDREHQIAMSMFVTGWTGGGNFAFELTQREHAEKTQ